jgi:ATP-binding cassette subfamily B protein RaxB
LMQTEAAECGLACIAMIANYHGHSIDLASLRRRFSTSLKGARLERLMDMARQLDLDVRPLRAEMEYLESVDEPCVLHWNLNHFVVLERVERGVATIHDPARGTLNLPLAEVGKSFTGIALEFARAQVFSPVAETRRVTLRALTGRIKGLRASASQVFALAISIEVMALLVPFQMQWVIDHVLVSGDRNLLLVIAVGFLISILIQTGLMVARGWLISWLGSSLNAQWISNLFAHLLRLPMTFFERRHMGDVLSRFTSLKAIQSTLTGGFVEAVLNGLTSSLALVVIFAYSVPLGLIVLAAFSIYGALRWTTYRRQLEVNKEQLFHAARQQSELMESVRGMQAIKLANKQALRQSRLVTATGEAARREMQNQRIGLTFTAVSQGVFGIQRVLLISIGAYMALQGEISAGMLVALVGYADLFTGKAGVLIDRVVDFKLLNLHGERIADIAMSEPEPAEGAGYSGDELEPSIEVRGLSFRYSPDEPWIFRDINCSFFAGESVAIVGPSGCGKSTLAKLILGLLEPTEGTILVGGVDIQRLGVSRYRELIGAVMQDDQLFAGSLADNISFFDADASLPRIAGAAHAAAIHEDIAGMPMGYESLVGDMGSALSGGQRQRLILARALYRAPRILVLDEATSHLDAAKNSIINQHIKSMKMTRIIIAHREDTIASADRRVHLGGSSIDGGTTATERLDVVPDVKIAS